MTGAFTVSIYSSVGELVYQEDEVKSSDKIDLHGFKSGLFLAKIETENSVYLRKVLKE